MNLVSVQALADRWGVSSSKIYEIKDDIGYFKIDGAIRFSEQMIEEYLEQRRRGRKPAAWTSKSVPYMTR